METIFREIFTDGRTHPADPSPTWLGYSVGKWEGDTLVVDTLGFNDMSWLDARGHGHSEDMRVEGRFRRRDFGHMDVTVTMTDPKTFTKPVTISFVEELLPDTDVFEHVCYEDEKDAAHVSGKVVKERPTLVAIWARHCQLVNVRESRANQRIRLAFRLAEFTTLSGESASSRPVWAAPQL